jgi:putative ABC transport system permease protein
MIRTFRIIWTSLKMALQEFRSNKLRTFLSLLGIIIGIFCIISVLSTISSLQLAINTELKAFGNKTIYIDKWQYTGGPDYPWWKFVKRPTPKFEELRLLRMKVPDAAHFCFEMDTQDNVDLGDNSLTGVTYYGITEDFDKIQQVSIGDGRYFQQTDYDRGEPYVVMGFTIAERLFGRSQFALGQTVKLRGGKNAIVIGVMEKQGQSIIGGWDFDNSIVMTYNFMRQMVKEQNANPKLLVQAGANLPVEALQDELKGAMRSIRKLSPTQEDNFALNNIDSFAKALESVFRGINIGGWFIAGISLLVGMFGVANIMFVTVRERTSQIGLKKAIGAKRRMIMTEFLLESAFLCIIGGMIGLGIVFSLTFLISGIFHFHVFIPFDIVLLTVILCLLIGILSGIFPAFKAAKMNPVVAIRST